MTRMLLFVMLVAAWAMTFGMLVGWLTAAPPLGSLAVSLAVSAFAAWRWRKATWR